MRVLIACEFSGIVRDAFNALGHEVWSCDLLDCEKGEESGLHHKGDVLPVIEHGFGAKWDLMIAHPPCTYLANSGNRWMKDIVRQKEREKAIKFFMTLALCDIPKIVIENPIGHMSVAWRKPDQIIQPYEYGNWEVKATCLWLKNLPKLIPTGTPNPPSFFPSEIVHRMAPGKDRSQNRSRTYTGIAAAMAAQWGAR